MKTLTPWLTGLFILLVGGFYFRVNEGESQTIYTKEQLQLMTELDSINVQLLTLREEKKLVIATLGEENLPEKLSNPTKYYECTYSGCTSLLDSSASLNPTTGNSSE